ncbi:hypothetical protein OIE13_06130 [Streptosporangium sp. NBC_01810]|uniref:hypothetical protein n=1 Tax=Streptosporangium sp. NBC_01810 TaxID=2975951 RepID=UPI002DDAFB58|nr:hypothetical protein [Streptosporangium sp. NBC_01810]WSA27452.1 hypothetical protein OIE13_06130 [Streptosporangium sp. NBC_01810]
MTTDPRLKTITEALRTLIPGAVPDNLTVRVEEQLLAGQNSWDGTIDAVAAKIHHALHGRPEQTPANEPPVAAEAPMLTPEIAAHVLHHFGTTGGVQPDMFTRHLITAIASLGHDPAMRLIAAYAHAVRRAATDAGIRGLQDLAGLMLVPAPQDGGEHRG